MANLADANVDLVGEVFTEPGVDERELAMRYAAAAQTMAPLLARRSLHAYRSPPAERIRQAVITEAELAQGRVSGADEVTRCFADLVGFTAAASRSRSSRWRSHRRLFELCHRGETRTRLGEGTVTSSAPTPCPRRARPE